MRLHLSLFALLAALTLSGCGDSTGPSGAGDPHSIQLDVPQWVVEGQGFTLGVTVFGSNSTQPLASFSGEVAIEVSAGTIAPAQVTVTAGVATVEARISGTSGPVDVRARLSSLEHVQVLTVAAPGTVLEGDTAGSAAAAIPLLRFRARAQDYSTDHPTLTGVDLSFNTLVLVFEAGTSVGAANEALAPLQAEIVGGIPGVASEPTGMLYLRLPSATHEEMEAVLGELRSRSVVHAAVQDVLGTPDVIPGDNSPGAESWSWELVPEGGNFGLELIRAPQMWNLNSRISQNTTTGILDVGFTPSHPDLAFLANLTPTLVNDHGTHVAGTIGAGFDNGEGVDGLNPFASLVVRAVEPPAGGPVTLPNGVSIGDSGYSLYELIIHETSPRVINISMGWSWGGRNPPKDSATDAAVQTLATQKGLVFVALLSTLSTFGREIPLIVTSAGNSSGQPAVWNSAWNNAALQHGQPDIVVVESVANAPGAAGGATLSSFSNVGGHVSAPGGAFSPGQQVWSTGHSVQYRGSQGTSMAAPHVTGLASYLLSVDPGLTNGQLRSLLLESNNTVSVSGGAARRIDAFASVMDIDGIRNNDRVLRLLVDMDDGTEDGNRRTNPDTGEDFTGGNPTGGDGRVDMRDFRRWRDGVLAILGVDGLSLDGSPTHPKRDLNGNRRTAAEGDDESIYPFVDLNGDGKVDLNSVAFVPGRINREVTDLEVLQELFDDHHYAVADLDDLVLSADIAIRPAKLMAADDVVDIHSSIRPGGSQEAEDDPRFRRVHTGSPAGGEGLWQVYTVAVEAGAYTGRVVALDATGDTLHDLEREFEVAPGQDWFWDPGQIEVTIDPEEVSVSTGGVVQFTATVTGTDNTDVTWSATGGLITGGGRYTAGGTPGTFEVVAASLEDPDVEALATVHVVQSAEVVLDFGGTEPNPTVEGPVLQAGAEYRITVSGTYSIWTSEWQNGVCKGSPSAGAGGPTGIDAEYWFAIPVGSVLCGPDFQCCPNHTSRFRMSLDGGGGFTHVEPVDRAYNPAHVYEYRVQGQGMPVHFRINEPANRVDDYGILRIRIETVPIPARVAPP